LSIPCEGDKKQLEMCRNISRLVLALVLIAVPATSALAAAAVEVDPVQGKPGDVFEISGQGFGIDEKVQLDWDSIRLGNTRTDELGRFSASFAVPAEASPGTHTVKATGRPSKLSATATFTVLAPPTTTTLAPAATVAASGKTNTASGPSPTVSSKSSEQSTGSGSSNQEDTGSTGGGDSTGSVGSSGEGSVSEPGRLGQTEPPQPAVAVGGHDATDGSSERVVALAGVEVTPTALGLTIVLGLVVAVGLIVWWMYRSPKKENKRQPAAPWA
jgi:hypothetical protein